MVHDGYFICVKIGKHNYKRPSIDYFCCTGLILKLRVSLFTHTGCPLGPCIPIEPCKIEMTLIFIWV